MTTPELALLIRTVRWLSSGTVDRWSTPARVGQLDHPDFGWKVAVRLAETQQRCDVLRGSAYRWIRAALHLLKAEKKAPRRLPDVEAVLSALALFESDAARPVINGCLITSEANIPAVARALCHRENVIHAYSDLFFNVIDRRDELAFIRTVVAGHLNGGLLIEDLPATRDEELLQVGFRGTIEDVLRRAGWIAGTASNSNEVLSDRILRNLLVAGDDWTGSGRSHIQPPPAMVAHAIDHVKRSKADAAKEAPAQIGSGFGSLMREQLEHDASNIRASIAMLSQQKTDSPPQPNAA